MIDEVINYSIWVQGIHMTVNSSFQLQSLLNRRILQRLLQTLSLLETLSIYCLTLLWILLIITELLKKVMKINYFSQMRAFLCLLIKTEQWKYVTAAGLWPILNLSRNEKNNINMKKIKFNWSWNFQTFYIPLWCGFYRYPAPALPKNEYIQLTHHPQKF